MPKLTNLAIFWKPDACSQTVLPDSLLSDMNLLVSVLKKIFFSFLLQFAILVVFSYVQNSCVIEWNKTILQAYIFYFMCVHMALLHSRLFMPIQWLIGCSNFVVLMDLFSKDFWFGISKQIFYNFSHFSPSYLFTFASWCLIFQYMYFIYFYLFFFFVFFFQFYYFLNSFLSIYFSSFSIIIIVS